MHGWNCQERGLGGLTPPVYIYRGSFWVKIGFKFQSMGKILNNSTADPRVLLGQFQHWLYVVSLSAYVLRARIKSLKHIACTLQWHLLIFVSYAVTLLWRSYDSERPIAYFAAVHIGPHNLLRIGICSSVRTVPSIYPKNKVLATLN